MRTCGFTQDQCYAMNSGRAGTCDVNPFPATPASQAYAKYLPKPAHHKATK